MKAMRTMKASNESSSSLRSDPADIGPVEQAYALMARAAGIDMAETRLISAAGGAPHFATRRFDRPGQGRRVHMVSLCGALEASPHAQP